jgi:UDP-N-acetyl-D-glucosamine dehydrogenase
MPQWVVRKTFDALNDRSRSIRGSKILVLGIAYKKNIDDPRESPAFELLELFAEKGAVVSYSDPHIPVCPRMRKHDFSLTSVALTPESLAEYDCVVIATDHDAFDYAQIAAHASLIIDTRGRFRESRPNVVPA